MNNKVTVSGMITSIEFNHEILGEKFYRMNLSVQRMSGSTDIVPILVSDRVQILTKDNIDQYVKVIGQFRSYNKSEDEKKKLMLFVFAEEIFFNDNYEQLNDISVEGYICKQPTFRETPLGRQISDVMIAVNRAYGKSDYIPVIVWGRNAQYASTLNIGDYVRIGGRVQSREYLKNNETHVAYEVSASTIENIA